MIIICLHFLFHLQITLQEAHLSIIIPLLTENDSILIYYSVISIHANWNLSPSFMKREVLHKMNLNSKNSQHSELISQDGVRF